MRRLASPIAMLLVATLAACQKPVEQAADIRPVRIMVVAPVQVGSVLEYAGEVRPRTEARLGFRVPGKIVTRTVDVGAVVTRGQVLATLDQRDLQLAQDGARAQLSAARIEHGLAQAELRRYGDLRAKGFISEAELERRQSTFNGARARLEQAEAQATQQGNQTGYAVLMADVAGVVTAVEAEVGQVVSAGQPVLRVAPDGAREVAFAIPEDKVEAVRRFKTIEVRTWARPERPIAARVREIAPLADAATRTFAARVTMDQTPPDVMLGMTATIRFVGAPGPARITVPLVAVVRDQADSAVWVLDPANSTVSLFKIVLGGTVGNDVVVNQGLQAGQLVVTAGVHKLQPGQKVSRLPDGAVGSEPGPAAAVAASAAAAVAAPAAAAASARAAPPAAPATGIQPGVAPAATVGGKS